MLAPRDGLLRVGTIAGFLLLGLARSEPVAWGQEKPAQAAEFRLYDGFDGKLALGWEVLRPDPQTASLTKNPGRLTLTSEYGGLHGENYTGDSAKNVYLIPNPAKGNGDFVVTTCLEGFHPDAPYQQAGPLVYDDDNNYLKAVLAYNESGVLVSSNWETNGAFDGDNLYVPDLKWERLWLRIIKRGNAYESAYSTDGKTYTAISERVWGNGAPKKVGLAVMNENATREQMDAAFDFFEVRPLTAEEKNDPAYLERKKLQGIWEVVSSRLDGQTQPKGALSRFTFKGLNLAFAEQGRSLSARFTLNLTKAPKEMKITGLSSITTTAIYGVDGDRLVICMNPEPNAPAPAELETKEGDGRLLVILARMPAVKAAAVTRNAEQRKACFKRLDADRDGVLTREELVADYPSAEAAKQGAEIFDQLDGNRDGKLSLEEFYRRPRKVVCLQMDLDADGFLTVDELVNGELPGASEQYAAKALALRDSNGDGRLSLEEYSKGWFPEAFFRMDTDRNERASLREFQVFSSRLTQLGHASRVFESLDRNQDGQLEVDEFCKRTPEAFVLDRDEDGDGELTVKEYCQYAKTPAEREAAEKDLAKRDADHNGRLTVEEYSVSLQKK